VNRPAWLIISFFGAMALAWLGTWVLRFNAESLRLVDVPNRRSSHNTPTPRGGGLSFVIVTPILTVAAASTLGVRVPVGVVVVFLVSVLVAAVGLVDDYWHLPARIRFGAHLLGALILIASGASVREIVLPGGAVLSLGGWSVPITIFWVIGLTNAYNFMDGIDGLAAGQAIITAATLAWLSWIGGNDGVALALIVLVGGAFGFLWHNWPPARIFMGDVGSVHLGITFAGLALSVSGNPSSEAPFVAWVAVLALFLFDTGVTLASRVVRGQRWYEAHREHFYQRLIRQGWSHRTVTTLYLSAATLLGSATIAYWGYRAISPVTFVGLVVMPLAGLVGLVLWIESRSGRSPIGFAR
jgi:UDP-N-acetylmuramyl pentapeptide phosphotransferase/UDP-N-acetylglucosamine-1-phosphate transferase